MKRYHTSESVSEGHPDKMADFISDSILDELLAQDPNSRVAVETLLTTGLCVVAGEVTSKATIDVQSIVRNAATKIGYTQADYGFDAEYSAVIIALHGQSPDIADGVDQSEELRTGEEDSSIENLLGAGDQGMMFGYATNETEDYLPLQLSLAHGLVKRLSQLRKSKTLKWLRPDAKAQVTIVRDDNTNDVYVDTVVISAQHDPNTSVMTIRHGIMDLVISDVIHPQYLNEKTKYFINPSGRFVIGGPHGDTGLTGRKIIVDTYGGAIPHGGGAFSGKDPTKVDRSAAYYARYVAKNLVAAGYADRLQVEVSYAIGRATPVSLRVDSFGTSDIPDEIIQDIIEATFDFRPMNIINELGLRSMRYAQTAAYGHFGPSHFPWERLDKVDTLIQILEDHRERTA